MTPRLLLMVLLLSANAASAGEIEIWLRPPAGAPDRGVVARVDPAKLPLTESTRFDVQYGAERTYRGVPLAAFLRSLEPPHGTDTALLHLRNGMIVPASLAAPPDVLLAVGDFPPVPKRNEGASDPRPITFAGNKLVASALDHPDVSRRLTDGGFSPWLYADSLAGVEFVERVPYEAQFDVAGDDRTQAGRDLFRESCAFCHGARRVGAGFGWDLVEPLPAADLRPTPAKLHGHLVFRSSDAAALGQMMPAIKPMTAEDAAALHAWLRALAAGRQAPYRPLARPGLAPQGRNP